MIRLHSTSHESFTIPLRTPFRFGVVELRELKHFLLLARFEIDGEEVEGIAGENLAPKWFSKNSGTTLDEDILELEQSIGATIKLAGQMPAAKTPFDFWLALYRAAAHHRPVEPKLVRQLGVSMVERAMIDAFCRRLGRSFHSVLNENLLGVRVSAVHPEIADSTFNEVFPLSPAQSLMIRHTVGLSDDLTQLPGIIASNGIRRLKIKLGGDPQGDAKRIADILKAGGANIDRITLDGNENYRTLEPMRDFLLLLRDSNELSGARRFLAWIEQPLHRDIALHANTAVLLREFAAFPHVIDESDDDVSSVPRALELGYAGTTHKNCKGVFKSTIAKIVLHEHEQRTDRRTVFSGEDLTIISPWSQAADLTVAAALNVVDVERNGQHYADGLSAFSQEVQSAAMRDYPSLYETKDGAVSLRMNGGAVDVSSIHQRPGLS